MKNFVDECYIMIRVSVWKHHRRGTFDMLAGVNLQMSPTMAAASCACWPSQLVPTCGTPPLLPHPAITAARVTASSARTSLRTRAPPRDLPASCEARWRPCSGASRAATASAVTSVRGRAVTSCRGSRPLAAACRSALRTARLLLARPASSEAWWAASRARWAARRGSTPSSVPAGLQSGLRMNGRI